MLEHPAERSRLGVQLCRASQYFSGGKHKKKELRCRALHNQKGAAGFYSSISTPTPAGGGKMNIVALLSHSFLLTNLWGKEKRLQGGRQRCSRAKENLQAGAFCVSAPPLPTCSPEGACYKQSLNLTERSKPSPKRNRRGRHVWDPWQPCTRCPPSPAPCGPRSMLQKWLKALC